MAATEGVVRHAIPNPKSPCFFTQHRWVARDAAKAVEQSLRKLPGGATAGGQPEGSEKLVLGVSLAVLRAVTKPVPTNFTARDVAQHIITFLTHEAKGSLIDMPGLIPRKQVGPATHYLCYGWDSKWHELMDTVEKRLGESEEEVFLYVDVFSVSAVTSPERSPPDVRLATALRAITGVSAGVLVYMDGAASRLWQMYELWVALRVRGAGGLILLDAPSKLAEIEEAVDQLDLAKAACTSKDDYKAIIHEIARATGGQDPLKTASWELRRALLGMLGGHHPRQSGGIGNAIVMQQFAAASRRMLSVADNLRLEEEEEEEAAREHAHFGSGPHSHSASQAALPVVTEDTGAAAERSMVQMLRGFDRWLHTNRERLESMVDQFDGDSKGWLNLNELGELMLDWRSDLTGEQLHILRNAVDVNHEGKITLEMLRAAAQSAASQKSVKVASAAAVVHKIPPVVDVVGMDLLLRRFQRWLISNKERLQGLFDSFDTGDKGYLEAAELKEVVAFWNGELPEAQVEQVVTMLVAECDNRCSADVVVGAVKALASRAA